MGHDFVKFSDRAALFRDPHLNLVGCIMLAVAERRPRDEFGDRLLDHLREFEWLTTGVFTDLRLDYLLRDPKDIEAFLAFLDDCAAFLCDHGATLEPRFLNALVRDSDNWTCELAVTYPLAGLGRLANLIVGSQPPVLANYTLVWQEDGNTARMKQQEQIEERGAES